MTRYPRLYSLLRSGKASWVKTRTLRERRRYRQRQRRVEAIEEDVRQIELQYDRNGDAPVVFFNASSHLTNFSYNAAVGLLTAWSLRVSGQPVVHLVCHGGLGTGLGKCVQGTSRANLDAPPPCQHCIAHNSLFYPAQHTRTFSSVGDGRREAYPGLRSMSLDELIGFQYGAIEIGRLCVPSVRWALRRHSLNGSRSGQRLLVAYIASAVHLVDYLERQFDDVMPRALVAFNGTFFPEAAARCVAIARGIPVITYESGFRPMSAFFTDGIASAFEFEIPESFDMGPRENAELDNLLAQRVRGNFTMGGVRFWKSMKSINPELIRKAQTYQRVVTIFTNIVFDTSQALANTIFDNMFDWLQETLKLASSHPETLFIVRAHPDEYRPGKESTESVEQFMQEGGYLSQPNISFIGPFDYISSYELIDLSQFCIVYNSTIGLEATIRGKPVVAGAHSKYSHEAVTHEPTSRDEYRAMLISFLNGGALPPPVAWRDRARRFMYYMVFRASLDLSAFIQPFARYETRFTDFNTLGLHPDNSTEMGIILNGITRGEIFQTQMEDVLHN